MAYEVIFKKRFSDKLLKLFSYIEKKWSAKAANDFLLKIDRRIRLLEKQPFAGAPTSKVKNVRGLLVTRHNKLYYKIEDSTVVIIDIIDTRMNPKRNPY